MELTGYFQRSRDGVVDYGVRDPHAFVPNSDGVAADDDEMPQHLMRAGYFDDLHGVQSEMRDVRSRNRDPYGDDPQHWPEGQRQRYENLERAHGKLVGELEVAKRDRAQRLEYIRSQAQNPYAVERADMGAGGGSSRDDWSAARTRPAQGGDTYSRAQRNINGANRAGMLPDYAAERATRLLEHGTDEARSVAARWAAAAGDPAYLRAFTKLVADPQRGHMLWDGAEQQAYREATHVRAAMTIGAGAGGELVPLTLDPSIILTNAGSINPLRRIARTVQTATSEWVGVTSAGATSEWKAEGVEAEDGSPALADLTIPVHASVTNVTFSYELQQDATSLVNELSRIMRDSIDNLHNVAFTVGTGTTQPDGLIPGGTSVNNAAGAFVAADLYTLQNSLPPRFSERAVWAANLAVINKIRTFESTNGSVLFPEVSDGRLLNKPLHELSNMSGDFSTTSSKFLAYFDPQEFVIVDHVGSLFELLPGYGANRRPTGQRHALLFSRHGSAVAVPTAVRVLNKTA